MNFQARCVHCGHTALLLLVFGEGLIQRARVGCLCGSFLLQYLETEQILHDRNELVAVLEARNGTHIDSRASFHAAAKPSVGDERRRGAFSRR
jgi:predicted  nucleic acid-binding Zn-ribbon protein